MASLRFFACETVPQRFVTRMEYPEKPCRQKLEPICQWCCVYASVFSGGFNLQECKCDLQSALKLFNKQWQQEHFSAQKLQAQLERLLLCCFDI
jgi:hypothetical protein